MVDILLKRGETRDIEALLQDGLGAALNLTGGTVKFQMSKGGNTALKIDRAATVVDPVTARVRVTVTTTDTDTAGNWKAEWRVTYAGGYVIVPEGNYLQVQIKDDLAP